MFYTTNKHAFIYYITLQIHTYTLHMHAYSHLHAIHIFIQVNRDLMVVPLAGAGGQLAVFEVLS